MRKGLVILSVLLLFFLLFSYFYLPSERMNDLYQKIPEQVRQNSQLLAAYYSSQTGLNGFREYQFALYDPENKTISVYTFKTYKFLKIWPRMKKNKITCKTPFNYSLLSTSPEKLKDFKNCDNCREFLYNGKIYRDEEIENIYPSIEEVIKGKENATYVKLSLLKDSEISTGAMELSSSTGDIIFYTDYIWHGRGLLYLPSPMLNFTRGVVIEFLPVDNETIKRVIHYPGNITLSDEFKITEYYRVNITQNLTWTLKEVLIRQILQKLDSKQLQKVIEEDSRVRFEISKEPLWGETPRLEAWIIWIDRKNRIYGGLKVYPTELTRERRFKSLLGYRCS
ncbi:hypothetical protein A3L09_05565 [Thermococcus profundus]|uniref:Uncharacterized protein n=1 Tax=Thermococcus profundus TaxID=49899 RepID=A0A2Z2MAF7_THEPR|nr:hypothetical protein [Thermococcus profundus]ASJ02756.1 hypothetical protein A3L09_05565 [Thermococcus profundus]